MASSGWRIARATKKIGLGEWHHVAATFDGQTNRLFLDGELLDSELVPGPISPSSIPLRIGQSAYDKIRGTRGCIDEVGIFNRALSLDEVRTVFRIGQAGRPLVE
ncbi:MAG: hypothetical protein CMJ64_26215 [Planctomycetaceae bacterium]|nr:hypothetical protein [Planctomycetaceae bacterium]